MTLLSTIETSQTIVLAFRSTMIGLTTLVAPHHLILTFIRLVTLFTTPIALDRSRSSFPTCLLPIISLMFPFYQLGYHKAYYDIDIAFLFSHSNSYNELNELCYPPHRFCGSPPILETHESADTQLPT